MHKSSQPVVNVENYNDYTFNTGDILVSVLDEMPYFYHASVVLVDDDKTYVCDNSPLHVNVSGGSICTKPLDKWIQNREVITIQPSSITQPQIETALIKLKKQKYNLLHFNCEHFISYIKYGYTKSPQVFWIGISLVTFIIYRLIKARNQ
jgi:hypothetical protein